MKLYQKIAKVLSQKNTPLKEKELALLVELLPIGNAIETECDLLLNSTKKRIVIFTAYWHPIMKEWINHQVIITPSFEGEIDIRVTGKNVNNIKQYLHDVFREALLKEYEVFKKGWDVKDSSEIKSELN